MTNLQPAEETTMKRAKLNKVEFACEPSSSRTVFCCDDQWYTLEDAIEKLGFGRFQMGMVLYTGMCWLADAMEMILLSYIGPAVRCEWHLSGTEESYISSSVFLGVLIGAYVWGIVADIKGRRPGFFVTAVVTLLFGVLSAWSPRYWLLLIFRTMVGFGIGGSPVIFSLCSEFLPSSRRGFWLVCIEFFWTIGTVLEAFVAWAVMPHLHWRVLVLISAFPFLLLLVFYPWLPESPSFLLVNGDTNGALEVLKRVAAVNRTELPAGKLLPAVPRGASANQKVPHAEKASLLPSPTAWTKLSTLLSKRFARVSVILWIVSFASAFTYYGQLLLTTELAVTGGRECPVPDRNETTRLLLANGGLHSFKDLDLQMLSSQKSLDYRQKKGRALSTSINNISNRQDYFSSLRDLESLTKFLQPPWTSTTIVGRHLLSEENRNASCTSDGHPNIPTSAYINVVITSFAELPGLIVALAIVDLLGKRNSLALLVLLSGAFVLPLLVVQSQAATTALLFVARGCIMGSFAILWAYGPDLYPTDVRATGLGVGNAWSRLGGFACPFVAVDLVARCQKVLAIEIFAFVPAMAALMCMCFPPLNRASNLSVNEIVLPEECEESVPLQVDSSL